ncbi:MAG: SGNH/GDSL hydrolase family protein [Planctomycetota bacterium]
MNDRARKLVLALLLPVALLGVAEAALRWREPDLPADAMFKPIVREGRELWQRAPSKNHAWYPPYSRSKPAGTLRVACVGGSTVEGNPFFEQAFPRVLERRLATLLAPRPVEVMGCGVGGQYSDGELRVLREVLDFEPDIVVLYSAHNEFQPLNIATVLTEAQAPLRSSLRRQLLRTAVGRALLGAADGGRRAAPSLADQTPRRRPIDNPEYPLIVERFRSNLQEFVDLCRARELPVVLCTAVSNLRDFPPMADVFAESTPEAERERWRQLVAQAEAARTSGDAALALARLEEAAAIDALPAGLAFQRGHALLLAGRPDEALQSFRQARDSDGRLHRAATDLNEAVLAFAAQPGVLVADVEAAFAVRSPHGIVGREWIVDNVHPTVAGQALIADEIVRTLAPSLGITVPTGAAAVAAAGTAAGSAASTPAGEQGPDPGGELLSEAEQAARVGLNNLLLALEKGRAEGTAAVAQQALLRAQSLAPERQDVVVGLGLLAGLRGESELSAKLLGQALEQSPDALSAWARAARDSPSVAGLFRRGGITFQGDQPQRLP